MSGHTQDLDRFSNPSKTADDIVLGLSLIEREGNVSPELLKEGIEFCDYLMNLLEEVRTPSSQKEQWISLTIRDKDAIKESMINIDDTISKLKNAKECLNKVIESSSSLTPEQIRNIQEILVNVTMPMWRKRTAEFREKKLKRGLIIDG